MEWDNSFSKIRLIGKKNLFWKSKQIKTKKSFEVSSQKLKNKILIPIGGGKDSITTLEILKKQKIFLVLL